MENGCNDQRSATGSWHQDAIGLLHPRLIANSDRPELQNTRSIMTCLNIQDAEERRENKTPPEIGASLSRRTRGCLSSDKVVSVKIAVNCKLQLSRGNNLRFGG